uniref:uncharacterized protein LOC132676261 n=1 Tax=Panthera onca TaxID=9690 RepID=UPI002955A4B9|nr:uncharacterized protein LOC132676261 [Panthera onca]
MACELELSARPPTWAPAPASHLLAAFSPTPPNARTEVTTVPTGTEAGFISAPFFLRRKRLADVGRKRRAKLPRVRCRHWNREMRRRSCRCVGFHLSLVSYCGSCCGFGHAVTFGHCAAGSGRALGPLKPLCVDAALPGGCVARGGPRRSPGGTPEARIRRGSRACKLRWDPCKEPCGRDGRTHVLIRKNEDVPEPPGRAERPSRRPIRPSPLELRMWGERG